MPTQSLMLMNWWIHQRLKRSLVLFHMVYPLVLAELLGILSPTKNQGRKLHANAESDADELVDPPKVEEKLGVVPHGLSTGAGRTFRNFKSDKEPSTIMIQKRDGSFDP
ncbi:hypothetical protein HanPSC8_Chr11g0462671 [Helianthus annuus]|nr:hypothetical protein HanPSC8_Chr11g0462671 [Helianthus annuus]